MNVYTESNFVLELALLQEEGESCERILRLAEIGEVRLVIPAYSLVEPFETLSRRRIHRNRLRAELDRALYQLARTRTYTARAEELREVVAFLVESTEEELDRFEQLSRRLLGTAELVPLSKSVLRTAREIRLRYDLAPQDSVVFASVVKDLEASKPARACLATRNPGDFRVPALMAELARLRCKLISRFSDAVQYLESQLPDT